jgi:hypothetical protein
LKLTPWIVTKEENLVRYFYTGESFSRDDPYNDVAFIMPQHRLTWDNSDSIMLADALLIEQGFTLLNGYRFDYNCSPLDYMSNARNPERECYIIAENETDANDIFDEKQKENYYLEDMCEGYPEITCLEAIFYSNIWDL